MEPPRDFPARPYRPSVLILFLLTGISVVLQLSTYPNHDVAWVLWGARELLNGAKWGVDVVEANPPLAWYLAMPPTAIAEFIGVPLDWTFRIAVAFAAAASAGSLLWLAPRGQSQTRTLLLCATAGALLLIVPGREFGQREHLLVIAILPYLALSSNRLTEGPAPGKYARLAIGALAGIGVALKPYFLAIPLLVEIALQLLGRRRPRLFRAENLAGAAIFLFYGCWLLLFERTYLREVIPLAQEIYWSYEVPLWIVLLRLAVWLLGAAPFAFIAARNRDSFGIILVAALGGLAVSYLVQHKGYTYHLLPVAIATLMLAVTAMTASRISPPLRWAGALLLAALVLSALRPPVMWWATNRAEGPRTVEIDRVRESLARHAPDGRFLVVSVHHYPAFPTAIYTSTKYVSRTNSQWFLSAVAQIREGRAVANPRPIERHAREFILHDLRKRPDIVIVDTNSARHTAHSGQFEFLPFFMEDPKFRDEWRAYREIEPVGKFRQFLRVTGAQPPSDDHTPEIRKAGQ